MSKKLAYDSWWNLNCYKWNGYTAIIVTGAFFVKNEVHHTKVQLTMK
jgi:hypothetical protein